MRRHVFLFISFLSLALFAEPYKPYPILFVHGYRAGSGSWGVKPDEIRSDTIYKENIEPGSPFDRLLPLMQPYAWAWYEWEKEQGIEPPTYTPDTVGVEVPVKKRFPNKCFLEVVNMDDNEGSVDEGEYNSPVYHSWAEELYARVKGVLKEYYGECWADNTNAKIILIGHSTGGLAIREMLRVYPDIREHVAQVITVDTPHQGSPWATHGEKELFVILFYYISPWLPYVNLMDNLPIDIENIQIKTIEQGLMIVFEIGLDAATTTTIVAELLGELGFWFFSVYTPVGEDLARPILGQGEFLQTLNSSPLPPIEKGYTCIVSHRFLDAWLPSFYTDYIMLQIEGLAALQAVYATTRAFSAGVAGDWVTSLKYSIIALLKIACGVWWYNWVYNSDAIVWEDSQNLKKVYPIRKDIKVEPLLHTWHCKAERHWERLVTALEDPPKIYIDSLVTVTGAVISVTDSDEFGATERISRICGRIKNYFLASDIVKYSINHGEWKELKWMEDFGYDGNKFHIANLDSAFHFGVNDLRLYVKNIEGDITVEDYEVVISLGPTVMEVFPKRRGAIKGDIPFEVEAMYKDKHGLVACSLKVTAPNGNVWMKGEEVEGDSLNYTLALPANLPEGEYVVEAWTVNSLSQRAGNTWSFFIDRTPPMVEIKEVEGKVYSSRVMKEMPIKYRLSDNMDEYLTYPRWLRVAIYKDNTLVWEDTLVSAFRDDRITYWDFTGEMGSGEYVLVLETMDRAGNIGADTVSFYLDNEPPVITVISPFDSLETLYFSCIFY